MFPLPAGCRPHAPAGKPRGGLRLRWRSAPDAATEPGPRAVPKTRESRVAHFPHQGIDWTAFAGAVRTFPLLFSAYLDKTARGGGVARDGRGPVWGGSVM